MHRGILVQEPAKRALRLSTPADVKPQRWKAMDAETTDQKWPDYGGETRSKLNLSQRR